MKIANLGFFTLLIFSLNGCSLFFGNIKPVEEKSKNYGILDLSQEGSDWTKYDQKPGGDSAEARDSSDVPESGVSDVAFQSKKTGSIISMNSACKSYPSEVKSSTDHLQRLTRELFLGISNISLREERSLTIDHIPALETTIKGKINDENMMLRAVVLQRVNCVYDLMYVSRPERFNNHLEEFSRFVSSLKLK